MDMTDATDELVRQVSGIPQELGAGACFGDACREGWAHADSGRAGEFGYGLGFGGGLVVGRDAIGDGSGEGRGGGGGGGGGGGSSTPVAIIDVSASGVSIEPIEDKTRIAMARHHDDRRGTCSG